jgi:hypothetical protein
MKQESDKQEELSKHTLYQISREINLRQKGITHQQEIPKEANEESVPSTITRRGQDIAVFSTDELHKEKKSRQKVIYGMDNRKDYYELDENQKKECEGVASLFFNDDVMKSGNDQSKLRTGIFGTAYGLCNDELFRNQPIGAFCSGFLVADDLVATAGHCVEKDNVKDISFVFGFRMNDKDNAQTTINNDDIYRGKEIVKREQIDDGADYCLVRLDRPVQNRKKFNIRKSEKIGDSQGVYVIGHPCGLPIKYADGAWVRNNDNKAYFVANCDTYGGNSGSPVLNKDTREVEGILVRGEKDFDDVGSCKRSNICPDTGCRGEDITRATEFAGLVS